MTNYQDYLKSKHWDRIRRAALRRSSRKCQVCGIKGAPLHVHHNDYARRGRELAQDLIVLCEDCHAIFHERLVLTEKKREAVLA